MYVNQMDYSEEKNLSKIIDDFIKNLEPELIAGIIHDKDNKDGDNVKNHYHIFLKFKNARSLTNIANIMDLKEEHFQKWDDRSDNGFLYLIHGTKESNEKFQYSPEEVLSNFDYVSLIEKVKNKQKKKLPSERQRMNYYLDAILRGEMTVTSVESSLTGSQIATGKKKLETVTKHLYQQKAKEWQEKKIDSNEPIEIVYIFGPSGVSKTRLAKLFASKITDDYFISGSSRDGFQDYNMQSVVILDELRPTQFAYQDLLKILDNYSYSTRIPSRYFDKPLVADIIFITTPFSPQQFYSEAKKKLKLNNPIDSDYQLFRRLGTVFQVTEKEIISMEYDRESKYYRKSTRVKNPYYKREKVEDNHSNQFKNDLLYIIQNNSALGDENE